MKILFSLFLVSLSVYLTPKRSLKVAEENYTIEGTIRGINSDWVYISRFDSLKIMANLDSAQVVNEKFKFTGTVKQPEFCYLGLKGISKTGKRSGIVFQGEFILDKGTLNLKCHKDSISKLVASGTQGQNEYNLFNEKSYPQYLLMNEVYGKILNAERKKDKLLTSSLRKQQLSYLLKIKEYVLEHSKAYPNSVVSAIIVKNNLNALAPEDLNAVFTFFNEEVKNSVYGSFVYKKMQAENRTDVGKFAPTFELPDQMGKMISLASYKGKVTLVDFWASWCGPCRAENPNLIKAYANYSSKGFDILSVSMDSDRSAWLKAVKEDKLQWTQISDLKGTKSELKVLYGITSIPLNFLLDQNGKIIARNLRGPEVQEALAKSLN